MRKLNYTAPRCESLSIGTNSIIALSVGKNPDTPVTDPGKVRSNAFETPKFTWRNTDEKEEM